MGEEWPKVVGFLIGVSVLAAVVWLVRWWRERSAKARERERVWAERLRATDDEFLAACGVQKDDPYAALALGLRHVIVDKYDVANPPVNVTDRVDVWRLGSVFDDGFDYLDFVLRMEMATWFKIPRGVLDPFFAAMRNRHDVAVCEVVKELLSAARNARLERFPPRWARPGEGPLTLPSPPSTGERG